VNGRQLGNEIRRSCVGARMADAHRLPWLTSAPRLSARAWLVLGGALGCSAVAYAGVYPRVEGGTFRHLVALVTLPFAGAVTAAALSAPTRGAAFWRAMGLACLLGIAAALGPGFILVRGEISTFPALFVFAVILGAPSGLAYGVPLGALVAAGHAGHAERSHEGVDRAARVAGAWAALSAAAAFAFACVVDVNGARIREDEIDVHVTASMAAAVAVFVVGATVAFVAQLRIARRAAWMARVHAGAEPFLRARPLAGADDAAALVRVAAGDTIVEWCPDSDASAYRAPAARTPLAIIR